MYSNGRLNPCQRQVSPATMGFFPLLIQPLVWYKKTCKFLAKTPEGYCRELPPPGYHGLWGAFVDRNVADAYVTGDRVWVQWSDWLWYQGEVTDVNTAEKRIMVHYTGCDHSRDEWVKEGFAKVLPTHVIGDTVLVFRKASLGKLFRHNASVEGTSATQHQLVLGGGANGLGYSVTSTPANWSKGLWCQFTTPP